MENEMVGFAIEFFSSVFTLPLVATKRQIFSHAKKTR